MKEIQPGEKSEVEVLRDRVEQLKEAEGALMFLLRDPDPSFRLEVFLKVNDYLIRRRDSRRHWSVRGHQWGGGFDIDG